MSLDKIDIVDSIGTELDGQTVVLSIIDSWNWSNQGKHLLALQDKLNAYFDFVESGQIYKSYPDAVGKKLNIDIVSKHPLPDIALGFLDKAAIFASKLNLTLSHRVTLHTPSNRH